MAVVNLLSLYQRAFGFVARPSSLTYSAVNVPINSSLFNDLNIPEVKASEMSDIGTPIFLPCTIDDYKMPNEPIINISGSKKIIETDFDGQDGTFKEIFSLNDYSVQISGIAVSENEDEMPEEDIRQIRKLAEKRGSSKIVNDLCSIYNITEIVIYDFDFPTVPGEMSSQGYVLKCKSDKSLNLEVKKPK